MSKIGKKPVQIPENVKVTNTTRGLTISGPKGELNVFLPSFVGVSFADSRVLVNLKKLANTAVLGRTRAEIANAVVGVKEGWTKTLEIVGTGYRAGTDGKKLTMNLGFSHPILLEAPEGVTFQVVANKITVSGVDKTLVGLVASGIRKVRPVEPYKGKGLRYEGEVVRKKQGKAAKGLGGSL